MKNRNHTEQFKIRLTEADMALLEALAARRDIPVAVLGRAILVNELAALSGSVAVGNGNGRGAESLSGRR